VKTWRMVELVTTATITVPEVGPWRPNPKTNDGHLRGACAGPAWGWRHSDRSFHWESGEPPVRIGVLCDESWRPYDASEIPDLVPPPGGWHRSQVKRQKRVYASVNAADLPA